MKPYYADEHVTLYHGDSVDVLASLPDASVDAVVTDPPYGLRFMGRAWDGADIEAATALRQRQAAMPEDGRSGANGGYRSPSTEAGRYDLTANAAFGQWCESWARECLRVLKPGGAFVAFGGTRTWHRLACAVEDAGFEIRDSIAWMHGQGFPKSLNVTKALESLPPCRCGVGSEVARDGLGVENTGGPASPIGAGPRAEAGAVPFAGCAADSADGIGAQLLSDSSGRGQMVDSLNVDSGGQGLPVMLGPSAVAGAAECEQVPGGVRGVEVNPEALRDEVVRDEVSGDTAIGAGAITSDDGGRDVRPSPPLVLPLATSPGGVSGAVEAGPIVGGHAGAGAIDPGVGPSPEGVATNGADVDAVPGALHGPHSTAQSAVGCEACGGVRGPIPQGLGTALKPAFEPIVVARKPLVGTVASNVLAWGTGALNIDATRVATTDSLGGGSSTRGQVMSGGWHRPWMDDPEMVAANAARSRASVARSEAPGRWPTNAILDESQAAALDQQTGVTTSRIGKPRGAASGDGWGMTATGSEYEDQGGASRFFPTFRYEAKAGSDERPSVDGIAHPTVKPLDLMAWLVRLVTPPGGTVLEPFAGSGTTAEACVIEGFSCIAIEREADYLPLIVSRLTKPIQTALFGGAA